MADEGDDRSSVIAQIRNGVTAVTLIVGAVVSLNTFLVTCSTQKISEHADFRKAVQAEETYWTSLYKDYETTFAGEYKTDAERRKVRLFVISQLTAHTPPDFAEYKVPEALKAQARAQFNTYQSGLKEALLNQSTSTPEIAAALQTQVAAAADTTIARPADGALVKDQPKEVVQDLAPTPTPSLNNAVLSSGKAQGWDVDVFWCQGAGADNGNYLTASRLASTLAAQAKAGTLVAGSALGRIRLRPLPAALNNRPGYYAKGFEVRHEARQDETKVASGLQAVANGLQPTSAPRFSLRRVGSRTPWYMSMFVCGPPAPFTSTAASPPSASPVQ